jgi:hypothetical protein
MKQHQDNEINAIKDKKLTWKSPTLTDLDSLSATEGKDSTSPAELADTVGPS